MDEPSEAQVRSLSRRTRRDVLLWLLPVGLLALAAHLVVARNPAAVDAVPQRGLSAGLVAVLIASVVVRRVWGNRAALRDPATRTERFWRAHVASAGVGTLAALLGLAQAVSTRPAARELVPFWVTALTAIALAFPRGYELDELDDASRHGEADPLERSP